MGELVELERGVGQVGITDMWVGCVCGVCVVSVCGECGECVW